MIVRVRFNNIDNHVQPKWYLFSVPDITTLSSLFNQIHCQELRPTVDLSWCDPDSCRILTAVTGKDIPANEDLHETSGEISLNDIYEKNRRLFVQYDISETGRAVPKQAPRSSDTLRSTSNSPEVIEVEEIEMPISQSTPSVIDVLMGKRNHFPEEKTSNKPTNDMKQYNSIVCYLKTTGQGVSSADLSDYEELVQSFSKLLWEVDPHYSKLKGRGKSFPKIVAEKFLKFNQPEAYKNKAKNMKPTTIIEKINAIRDLLDRKCMGTNKLKTFRGLVEDVVNNVSEYLEYNEDHRSKFQKSSSGESSKSGEDPGLEEFVISNIKMKVTMTDSIYKDKYNKILSALRDAKEYEPINLNSILDVGTSHKIRSQRYRFLDNMHKNGVPFVLPDVVICHFKLPSQGPHKAVHFLWKKPVDDEATNPNQSKIVCELREKRNIYYDRSTKREIKEKLRTLGIVKPHQASYIIKDLLGDSSAAENENQRDILERLNIVIAAGEEIAVDLRSNNGKKPTFDAFWGVVAEHIDEKTAVDDRRHSASSASSENNDKVVVNMAFALSYADLYRTCIKIAKEKGIEKFPTYKWFLLQFWPTSRSASKLLQYTGRFRVRRAVQARLLRKRNPDAHYARAVYKFLKKRAIRHKDTTAFLSADAKCKISVGEPGFPLAAVTRGKRVIIGKNQQFHVADHDYSKLSIIPDAVLVHQIPDSDDTQGINEDNSGAGDTNLIECGKDHTGDWYTGKVYYSFKNMVLQGSTALRGVVELGRVLETSYASMNSQIPERIYLITDGGGDRNIVHLSVRKALIGFFRQYDLDELIAIRTAAGLSFYNPVERMHARANQGLQGVGMMRRPMTSELERLAKKCNSNEEMRKACEKEPKLKEALKESLDTPIELLKEIFLKLSIARTEFLLYEPSSDDDLDSFSTNYDCFDEGIKDLKLKAKVADFPKFKHFLETHTSFRSYSFHIFKCEDLSCLFHKPLRGELPERFPDPVPTTSEDGDVKYSEGSDPKEKHLPSKIEDISKQSHEIPFTPTAQTAKNVGFVLRCDECKKPRLLYAKLKLKGEDISTLKRTLNDLLYVCGGSLREISGDENSNADISDKVFVRENLCCTSPIELPYYSVGTYQSICIFCGCSETLTNTPEAYPKCIGCNDKENILKKKRKTIVKADLQSRKKAKKN